MVLVGVALSVFQQLVGINTVLYSGPEIFARMGATEIQHRDAPEGAGHIMGTVRMGDHARTSVVDRDLRSHDHRNLFILGSAVFPTGATANPTLTIAALSLRAAGAVKAALSE